MILRVTVLILVAVCAIGANDASAGASDPLHQEALVDRLFQQFDASTSPGCAVAVMKDGNVVYQRGYGMADLEHGVRITPSTVFNVGSMSKQFTAAALLMLVQQGKVSLDDAIRKYVPEVPDFGTPITLRELLHHTSGLRDQLQLLNLDGWRLSVDLVTGGDVMYLLSRQKELNFPPDTDFLYSNSDYTLLAWVVERVSGQSLRQFTSASLFDPLGMRQTHFSANHAEIVKDLANAYAQANNNYQLSEPNYDVVGSTGVVTTVGDLARWDENFYTAKVGGERVIRQLQEPGKLEDGAPLHYAAGLYVYNYRGLRVIDHSGDSGGWTADLMRFPEQHFSAATLCNVSSIDPTATNRRIADIYLAGELKPVRDPRSLVELSQERLDSKAGTYIADGDRPLHLDAKDGALWADVYFGGSPARLEPESKTRFGTPYWRIDFADDSRLVWTSQLEGSDLEGMEIDRRLSFHRVPGYAPTTEELGDFAGMYRSPELDVSYFLTVEKNQLMLHWPKKEALLLLPVTTDFFVNIPGWRMRFVRDQQGRVSGFVLSNPRLLHFRFDRIEQPRGHAG